MGLIFDFRNDVGCSDISERGWGSKTEVEDHAKGTL